MPELTLDLTALSALRGQATAAELAARRAERDVAAARADLAARERIGVAADIAAARAKVTDLATKHGKQKAAAADLRDRIAAGSSALLGSATPDEGVSSLDGGLPVALLPARIETRFDAAGMRVRIFPEPIHLDSHEPELTDDEVEAGRFYWQAVWAAPGDTDVARSAWQALATRLPVPRARWVVDVLRPAGQPGNPAVPVFPDTARKAYPWTRAGRATLLPDRWLVVGYRGGRVVLRKWGARVPDTLQTTPSPEAGDADVPATGLPIDAGMRWIVDYAEAEKNGMAVTVKDADLTPAGRVAQGFDQLVVLGVDWTLTPKEACANLAALFSGHLHTDGLAFAAAGTPTNNTDERDAGFDSGTQALLDELEPSLTPPTAPGAWSAGLRLGRALGLPAGNVLGRVPGAELHEQRATSDIVAALWAGTAGHYLDELLDPLVSDGTIDALRAFAVQSLYPGGPFSALRVGSQPYGVLPVVASGRFKPEGTAQDRVLARLRLLRLHWRSGAARVPHMARTTDVDATLLELLQTTPVSARARVRRVYGPAFAANLSRFEDLTEDQSVRNRWLLRYLGQPAGASLRIGGFTTDWLSYPMRSPWVQAGTPAPGAPLAPNYIAEIAAAVMRADGTTDLRARDDGPLLERMLAFSALREHDRAMRAVVADAVRRADPQAATRVARRTAEFLHVTDEDDDDAPTMLGGLAALRLQSSRKLASVTVPEVSSSLTVAQAVAAGLVATTRPTPVANLGRFSAAADRLAQEPVAALDVAFRGYLDACSHRLDAWFTALATARLDGIRAGRADGVHLGGFGWVENVRPNPRPDSLGYIHTPSLTHAVTAALLRSGHLAHRGTDKAPLDIELTSDRVRLALELIEGVAEGQPLGALLGYRLERALRARDITLARFIIKLRGVAPSQRSADVPSGPVEAIAARDVVDAVALLERWRRDRAGVLNAIGATGADAKSVGAIVDEVAGALDAVGDVLLSEAVFQTVRGNTERAGAALAAIDRQGRPPDPEVVRTPRTGVVLAHRVVALMEPKDLPAGWTRDARANAEPRANAWLGALLPAPTKIQFGAVVRDASGETVLTASAAELGLSPLSLVLGAGGGAGTQEPSELEERVAALVASRAGARAADATLELLDASPAGPDTLGLAELKSFAGWAITLLGGQRPADATDLAVPTEDPAPGIDVNELSLRSNAAVAALDAAVAALDAVLANPAAAARGFRNGLLAAAALVGGEALPRTPLDDVTGRDLMRAQAQEVRTRLAAARERITAIDAGFSATAPLPAAVAHHSARMRLIFGEHFPVLPAFRLANKSEVAASHADRAALSGGDPLAPVAWLHRMALVRDDLEPLSSMLTASELLGSDAATRLELVQLPHRPGQRWSALPFGPEGAPDGAPTSVVVHAPGGFDAGGVLAGIVCDGWSEVVGGRTETTGLAFHYDAPAARAPQTILLAVPGDKTVARWSVDALLDTVEELIDLTHLRAVTPKHLESLGGILPALYASGTVSREIPSFDAFRLVATKATLPTFILGKD